jgi:hypothetical protein
MAPWNPTARLRPPTARQSEGISQSQYTPATRFRFRELDLAAPVAGEGCGKFWQKANSVCCPLSIKKRTTLRRASVRDAYLVFDDFFIIVLLR